MAIRKPYGDRLRVQLVTGDKSLTQQQHVPECEINNIVKKYRRTGLVQHLNKNAGQYGDVSEIGDYQTSLTKVQEGNNLFMSLPADLRKRFKNDPGEFLDFALNPNNADEMVKMGLARKPETPETLPIPEGSTPPADKKAETEGGSAS